MQDHQSPADFWEARYTDTHRVWSGRVNHVVAEVAASLEPGRALDLGCGEGGDAVWLAEHGWHVVGVDLSATAAARGQAAAAERGLDLDTIRFEAGDLTNWTTEERFDLVTTSFLHSWPVKIPREDILRRATQFVAPGGHMLVLAHAESPPWATQEHGHEREFPTPEQDLAALQLAPNEWDVRVCEKRARKAIAPDGTPAPLLDSVLLVQRRSA